MLQDFKILKGETKPETLHLVTLEGDLVIKSISLYPSEFIYYSSFTPSVS